MRTLHRFAKRLVGILRSGRNDGRLREEYETHLAMLTDEHVRAGYGDEAAHRRALAEIGSFSAMRDICRDETGFPPVETMVADVRFGWRQLARHRVSSLAAVFSLALATGAGTAAFRLVDAVLLRPLPVAEPENLRYLALQYVDREGRTDTRDDFDYPSFRFYRDAVRDQADVLLVGMTGRPTIVREADGSQERVYRQFVSGNLFSVFGLRPAAGRLLFPSDDVKPGGHPVAVISHEYWVRKYGGAADSVGRRILLGKTPFEIIGVAPKGYSGTEPGDTVDIFLPAAMNHEALEASGWSWFRIWLRPRPHVSSDQILHRLRAILERQHEQRRARFSEATPRSERESLQREQLLLIPASAGVSRLQKQFERPLWTLSILVVLVLLAACANVANLMTAQAVARSREMAVRVSLGAGRGRLIRMVLVECAMLAVAASLAGIWFASAAVPFVVGLLRIPQDPVRLVLDPGWREIAFSATLTATITLLMGLPPALRAASIAPALALKGGVGPISRRGTLRFLLVAQVAFCVVVVFTAALFSETFRRLANRPLGFDAARLLTFDVAGDRKREPGEWALLLDRLRTVPGAESVAMASWPLLSGNRWTASIRVSGHPLEDRSPYFLEVSSEFLNTMRMGPLSGREFLYGDQSPRIESSGPLDGGAGIVNEAFARKYFSGGNPVGQTVQILLGNDRAVDMEIVGLMRDTPYAELREQVRPIVFVPLRQRPHVTVMVRASGDPTSLVGAMRAELAHAGGGLRIENVQPYSVFVNWHLLRERLLSILSGFFAVVALALATIGLYGVLHDSVTSRRREIGIRMALGASAADVVREVTGGPAWVVAAGLTVGVAGGLLVGQSLERLLFEVHATDVSAMAVPILIIGVAAVAAAIPPVLSAVRTDPALTLRDD